MEVTWSIFCQSSAIDRDTNNLSLFNVIEELTVPVPPPQLQTGQPLPEGLTVANLELVTLFTRSDPQVPERGRGRVRLLLPEGREALNQEFEVDLTQYLRLRMRVKVPGFPTGDAGMYRFLVDGITDTSDWIEMFELPIRVALQPQESG